MSLNIVLILSACLSSQVFAATGLGDDFQPSVHASCTGGTMTIRVDTTQPFDGVIHTPNRTEPGCSIEGQGGLKTKFEIDLKKPAGAAGSCGVKYNAQSEETRVGVFVRAHKTIELLEDRLYIVTCGKAGFQNSRKEISVVHLKISDGRQKLNAVLEGSQYKLQVQVLNPDPEFGILVKKCFAFDDSDTFVQLVDDRGCRAQKLISDFSYDDSASTAEADIYSMFRMPHTNRTYFQCDVEICRGSCPRPSCELTRQEIQSSDDPFTRTQADDTVTTSTSVFVAEPGSIGAIGAGLCGIGDVNPNWLTYLCIAFGVLFGIMLLINIFLCSAMTCSCTKTEVIEKEPSIYDDYSVYESQYGYASKAYNSESDYGSEYGLGEGEERPRQHAPSDAGTLRSKYSRADNNTLSRSRQGSHGGSRYLE
ncbi:uncharacterized protein LOC111703818 [Eurytemora carolleeae]|uniref:uncharacterized protein LOC111703818 n=1 Tax=Eurytemora carolleeae TaxID=1294199 RepID=UPI000C76C6CF|nr:uncharacterized protein LOC111703818 [Eurytemora carolleeae]|eukprot:XP_023331650.1 uncharacterized protein LOC111703818 [Eurytemora affinis]